MISDERFERAAKAVFRGLLPRGCSEAVINNRWHDDDDRRNEALHHTLNALTADAPEIAAAEIRGLEMAKEIARTIGDIGTRGVRAAIDARIAELKTGPERHLVIQGNVTFPILPEYLINKLNEPK